MNRHCKECPYKVRNGHNERITAFAEKTGRRHNCHMGKGKTNLWQVSDDRLECAGSIENRLEKKGK
jgi:hypothetical protein